MGEPSPIRRQGNQLAHPGSLDTMLLAYLFTGSMVVASSIATTESLIKIVLYYLHERAWAGFSLGKPWWFRSLSAGRQTDTTVEGKQRLPSPGSAA